MHEWIEEVQKAAQKAHPGVSVEELRRAENELGEQFPSDLADLYVAMGGAALEGEVILFKLSEPEDGVVAKTRKKLLGLPAAGLWRFGRKGDNRHLFAARASSLREHGETGLPAWCAELPSDAWLFCTWAENEEGVRVYRNLEHMLSVLVPPIETEEFGESTFVRALTAVEQALLTSVSEAAGVAGASPVANDDAPAPGRRPSRSSRSGARTAKAHPPGDSESRAANNPKRTQAMAVKESKQKRPRSSDQIADVAALIAEEERAAKVAEKALRKAEKALRKAEKAERKSAKKSDKKLAKKSDKKAAKKLEKKGDKKTRAKKSGASGEKKVAKKLGKKSDKKAAKGLEKKAAKKPAKKSSAKIGKKPATRVAAGKSAAKTRTESSAKKGAAKRTPAKKPATKAVGTRATKKPAAAKATSRTASKPTGARTAKRPVAKVSTARPAKRAAAPKKPPARASTRTRSPKPA